MTLEQDLSDVIGIQMPEDDGGINGAIYRLLEERDRMSLSLHALLESQREGADDDE